MEKLLIVMICGLAFLLALTPARNSDLWLHLASGRWLLGNGIFPDGRDPFSSTTQGVYWVNQTWLSDLLLYGIYRVGNGTALVFAKSILMALVAALFFCFRGRGEGMGVLPFAGFAALVALAPWLVLQSTLLSLLGVVVTLYLLERPGLSEGAAAEKGKRGRWLLVPLFALWANLDSWFILGPLLVGLYVLGELLCRSPASEGSTPPARRFLLLFCAGLAACLATPYHYHIFAWPTPLGITHTEQALREDPLGRALVLSPFGSLFVDSALFRSPGAWAYYLLLAASAISFVRSIGTIPAGRLLVWLGLAGLSIYQARTIPFFAVAAAIFLGLNHQERSRSRPTSEASRRLRITDPRLGALIGIVLLVLAWPGWLQPAPYQPRGWTAEPDGSLTRLAEHLKRGHAQGYLRSNRFALTFSPEAANYLAWLCPEEKGFLDSRLPLFDRVADDYVQMRRRLLQDDDAGPKLASLLDAHQIDRILLYDSDRNRVRQAYRDLFLARSQWELLAVEGGAMLFRRDGATPSADAYDYARAAYHPSAKMPPAPRPPRPPLWYDVFFRPADERSADVEEAALHLFTFDLEAEQLPTRLVRQWLFAQAASLIGGSGNCLEPSGAASVLALRLHITPISTAPAAQPVEPSVADRFAAAFVHLNDTGPAEPLLLALRAARRALAANPDDGRAFLLLGEAYFRLAQQTSERRWQELLPTLAELRQAQILTTLEQAAALRPDLAQAHDLLAQIYFAQGQMDRCLEHRRAELQIAERDSKRHGSGAAAAADRLEALRIVVENLEKVIDESETTYQANLPGKTEPSKVLLRAQLAARYGLAHKALDMMLESSPAIFGRDGVVYQLDLMMKAGQSYQVRDWLEPDYERKIANYHWIKARAAAGCGDYAEADAELDKGSERLRRPVPLLPNLQTPVRSAVALYVGKIVLARPLAAPSILEALYPLGSFAEHLRQEADWQVLRGLLAVEAGAVEKAQQHFRTALDLWDSEAAAAAGGGLDFASRPIAQEMLHRLSEPRP